MDIQCSFYQAISRSWYCFPSWVQRYVVYVYCQACKGNKIDSFGVCVFTHNMLYGAHVVATIDWVVSKLTDNGKWSVQPTDDFCTGTFVSLEHLDEDFRWRMFDVSWYRHWEGCSFQPVCTFSNHRRAGSCSFQDQSSFFYQQTDQFPWFIRMF